MTKKRLDIIVHEKSLTSTRAQATMLIKKSGVLINGEKTFKPGVKLTAEEASSFNIELVEEQIYVSRGAYKLLAALEKFPLPSSIESMVCADIGASTGGFTQVLLERGASKVFAIDVGHDQLAKQLRENSKVINMEGVNARHPMDLPGGEKVDLIVSDLSHISLLKVLPEALNILKPGGFGIWLIKPQFEAGLERIGKNGIVSEKFHQQIIDEVSAGMKELGAQPLDIIKSPIEGKKGNAEYLTYFIWK